MSTVCPNQQTAPPPIMIEENHNVKLSQPLPQTELPFSFSSSSSYSYSSSSSSTVTTRSYSLRERPIRVSEEDDQTNNSPLQPEELAKRGRKRKLMEKETDGAKKKREFLDEMAIFLPEDAQAKFKDEEREIDKKVGVLSKKEIRKLKKNLRERTNRNLRKQKVEIFFQKYKKLQKDYGDLQIKCIQQAEELEKLRKVASIYIFPNLGARKVFRDLFNNPQS
jgi:hypothetical protein